jgi:TPR repeat protein
MSKKKEESNPSSIQDLNESMKLVAGIALNSDPPDYKKAFVHYRLVAENSNDTEAQYNLAGLYATGNGTERDCLLAAYWYKKAADQGDEKAAQLLQKATLDYFSEYVENRSPEDIFTAAVNYYGKLYSFDQEQAAANAVDLIESFAVYYHEDKQNYACAFRCWQAMAVFGKSDSAMFNSGIYFYKGMGMERNDLAALYWFDKAADCDNEDAKTNRDAIINAYLQSPPLPIRELFEILASWCEHGTDGVPVDEEKSNYWKAKAIELDRV